MPITVPMIEEKEFKTKVRGYDPVEVDEFLDEICDEMISMQEENARLQAQLAQAKRDLAYVQVPPAPRTAPAPAADASESAQKLIANAQRVYDDTVAQAKEEAAAILAKAKGSVSDDLLKEKSDLEQEIRDLRSSISEYRDRMNRMLDEIRSKLNAAEEE